VPGAREVVCRVVRKEWLTPSVFTLGFEPSKQFNYLPGQFLSIIIERAFESRTRRIYSFSSGGKGQYEVCVQVVPGGIGSNYLAKLNAGDEFRATAPYGDFLLELKPNQNVCFIATGTGIAPFKSMITSKQFCDEPPPGALLLFGGRTDEDILFKGFFEKYGIEVVNAVSSGSQEGGFKGRVTDYLKSLSDDFPWQNTVFYMCGNGAMIKDVTRYLRDIKNVPTDQIRAEAFFTASNHVQIEKKIAA
jgi:ferredoxin-NADP reductase